MSELDVYNKSDFPILSVRQKKIVLGCLLGRASIVKPPGNRNCYLYIRQSKKEDINILAYKAAELKNLGRPTAIVEDENSRKWYSSTNPIWNEFYASCYKDGKKYMTENWLNDLSSSSFAIMFMDLARVGKDSCLSLKIGPFHKQRDLFVRYFDEIGMACRFDKNKLIFNRKETNKFMSIISQDTPAYLLYRLQRYIP